jgi:hypothetical protein
MIRKPKLKALHPEPTSRIHPETEVCPQRLSIPPRSLFVLLSHWTEGLGIPLVYRHLALPNTLPADSFPVSTASP